MERWGVGVARVELAPLADTLLGMGDRELDCRGAVLPTFRELPVVFGILPYDDRPPEFLLDDCK